MSFVSQKPSFLQPTSNKTVKISATDDDSKQLPHLKTGFGMKREDGKLKL